MPRGSSAGRPAEQQAPLIAVSGRRRNAAGVHTGPASLDSLELDVYFTGYADYVLAAGGIAVYLPTVAAARDAIARVDALVLTGGVDLDPALYGAATHETSQPPDRLRDAVELSLFEAACARGIPVLAICRGMQLVNVACGGTLHLHLDAHPSGRTHSVRIRPDSVLGRLYGTAATVNSLHHQSVDRIGAGLSVTARSDDGVVEAVELDGADVLGVQWHPEQMGAPQPVFDWLVAAAGARACRNGRTAPISS